VGRLGLIERPNSLDRVSHKRPTVSYVPNLEAAFKIHEAWFHLIEMR
jgi:hypothetical protein